MKKGTMVGAVVTRKPHARKRSHEELHSLGGSIAQLTTTAAALVRDAEAIHGAGKGPSKLAHVLDGITETVKQVPELASDAAEIVHAMTPVVNAIVAAFNAFGILSPLL